MPNRPVDPLFAALAEHSSDSIMLVDLEGRIEFINRTAPGLSPADVIGLSLYGFVSEDQHAEMRRCFARVLETGEGDRYQNYYPVSADVVTRWESRVGPVKDGGGTTGFVVFASDVTARTSASDERDRIFELSHDLLCVLSLQGHFTRVNPAFSRTLGYTEAELLATPFLSLSHPDDRAKTTSHWQGLIQGGPVAVRFESRYLHKSGATLLIQWSAITDGTSRRAIATGRDITQQRALESQLRHSQKMNAVGQLAGGIAHDFNNLVQAILGNAQFALAATSHPEVVGYLRDIEAASVRASKLTRQLLAFSARGGLSAAPLDLNVAVRDLLQLVRRVIPQNIEIDFIAGHQLEQLEADGGQLEQVLMNLCLNARDAMPTGGKITIQTENLLIDGGSADLGPWIRPGRHVLVTVTDTGVGMTPEVRERAFEPFFSTKPDGQGSGLGLSVAYGIAQAHDGMLQVYSEPGKGATFKLYLPVKPRLASSVETKLDTGPTGGRQETILVADDESLVRSVLTRALERAGYIVLAAANGSEALRLCREHDAIDLAVLDVIMPDFTGPEVCAMVSKFRPGLPILFASGHSDASREAHRIPEHAVLLSKPFALNDLLLQVRAHLDRK